MAEFGLFMSTGPQKPRYFSSRKYLFVFWRKAKAQKFYFSTAPPSSPSFLCPLASIMFFYAFQMCIKQMTIESLTLLLDLQSFYQKLARKLFHQGHK